MSFKKISVVLFTCMACGKAGESDSKVSTIFAESNIEFLSSEDEDMATSSMGALMIVTDVAGHLFATTSCSAFKISPKHIMSAAHCYIEGGKLAFDPTYKARAEFKTSFEYYESEGTVRLSFLGLPAKEFQKKRWKQKPLMERPAYIDRVHDFAIWEWASEPSDQYSDWNRTDAGNLKGLALYSYPNGSPLARAQNCEGKQFGSVIRHNCDSLIGSSGGLLVNESGQPIALHVSGSADNIWADFQEKGRFESDVEVQKRLKTMAAQGEVLFWECDEFTGTEKDECQLGKGWNRAVRLDFIRDQLRIQQPELAESIEATKNLSLPYN